MRRALPASQLALVPGQVEVGQAGRIGDAQLSPGSLGKPARMDPHHLRGVPLGEDLQRGAGFGMAEQLMRSERLMRSSHQPRRGRQDDHD